MANETEIIINKRSIRFIDTTTKQEYFSAFIDEIKFSRDLNDNFTFHNAVPIVDGTIRLNQLGVKTNTEGTIVGQSLFTYSTTLNPDTGIAFVSANIMETWLGTNTGFFFNPNEIGTAFLTTSVLASLAVYDSGVLDMTGYSQVQTEISSSHDGTLDFIFYSDSAGADTVRTLSIPYLASTGYQFLAAPSFGYYVRYKFTNTSVSTQTDFYYTTKFITKSISGQITSLTGSLAAGMVANVGRNVIVGQDATGEFRNVNVTNGGNIANSITDSSLGFHAIVTAGGGLKTNESTHLVGEPFGGGALNTIKWSIDLVGSGAQDATGAGELTINTGTTANSAVEIESSDVARFIPANYNTTHHAITIPDGASYATNNVRKWGAITATDMVNCNGLYWELDSGVWAVVHCKNGTATKAVQSAWNGIGKDLFPDNSITANVYEIEYNAGSAIFRVNGNVMHRFNLTASPFADSVHFPVGMCNTNTGGSTIDVVMNIRAAAIYTLGKGKGQLRPYFISGTNTGVIVKTGAGHLGKIIFARAGGGGTSATILIYDALSATNQVGRIDIDKNDTIIIDFDFTFNVGLYAVIAGTGTLGTTITFD